MEHDFIRWLRGIEQPTTNPQVLLGIGDDGAILKTARPSVWVTDTIVENVHFDLSRDSLRRVGRKSLAVNLSDVAAMGAIPTAALLTMVLPKSFSIEQAQELFLGVHDLAQEFGVAIAGGDTNRHDGPLIVGVALSADLDIESKAPRGWRLGGAKLGDTIFVTGVLGGSILGKHLDFEPRVELARHLIGNYRLNAVTDVSDSLTVDLNHMITASNLAFPEQQVGAEIELDQVPVSKAAEELSQASDRTALEHALYDGEDFELLLSASEEDAKRLLVDPVVEACMFKIGRVIDREGLYLVDENGTNQIKPKGYEH